METASEIVQNHDAYLNLRRSNLKITLIDLNSFKSTKEKKKKDPRVTKNELNPMKLIFLEIFHLYRATTQQRNDIRFFGWQHIVTVRAETVPGADKKVAVVAGWKVVVLSVGGWLRRLVLLAIQPLLGIEVTGSLLRNTNSRNKLAESREPAR